MILIVRPLSVLLSVWPAHLSWRERLILAMTAPRGIVAAAVASLAAHDLVVAGIPGADTMEGMVYLAIVVTGGLVSATALTLILLPMLYRWLSLREETETTT